MANFAIVLGNLLWRGRRCFGLKTIIEKGFTMEGDAVI